MIIPSIDLAGGQAVQLVGGRDLAIEAGDPLPWLEQFAIAGDVAVIDLDAALGVGDQRAMIAKLCERSSCRVGGGIRDYDRATMWLDAGATKIVIGTAAEPALLRRLPRARVMVALDANCGEVVVEGWRKGTGRGIAERMIELRDYVSGFLVTFVEREGRLGGTDLITARELAALAGDARLTIAGGVTTADEIAELDHAGIDAQVGMALYSGKLSLADAITAPCRSDRSDGLIATVVTDERGRALGLVWSSAESLRLAIARRRGVYHSRTRGIWTKGETSGNWQELLRVTPDCDRDALRFTVRQHGGGFCHQGTTTCWGESGGLDRLQRTLVSRKVSAPDGSYTRRLLDNPDFLGRKIVEEAGEVVAANSRGDVIGEAADLMYFIMVRLAADGIPLSEVETLLDQRALRTTRRPGDIKPTPEVRVTV